MVALDSPDAAALGAAYKAMLATAKLNGKDVIDENWYDRALQILLRRASDFCGII